MAILKESYTISHDWSGCRYLRIDIDWDYVNNEVNLPMLSYVQDTRKCFHHIQPGQKQDQSHPLVKPTYGAKAQYATNEDTSPAASPAEKKCIQEVTGIFLYYTRAVSTTMLPALGTIATQQMNPNANTTKKVKHFLDYVSAHLDTIITYRASNMVFATQSNTPHLSESKTRSCTGGHFFISANSDVPANTGAVITVSKIIIAVMSSATDAELRTPIINFREAIPTRHALNILRHKQPPTLMQIDNTTVLGVATNTIARKCLKSIDMKPHWLCCCIAQRQFCPYW